MDIPNTISIPSGALSVIRRLQKHGFQAVFAGGCVRDMLLGRTPHDWDIATSARPEQVEAVFERTIPVGRQFGIIVVLVQEKDGAAPEAFEVATFRGDGHYTDGRHPDDIHFVEAREDVLRRDFTINALLYDPVASRIMDFVGGQEDLGAGIIRAVGEPRKRFEEDKLRVIRAVRFAARLDYRIEEATFSAMREFSSQIPSCVSVERIAAETEKMLLDGHAARAFDLMECSGVLQACYPELQAMKGVEQPRQFHPEGDVWQHTLKVLSALDQCTKKCLDGMNCTMPENPENRFSGDMPPVLCRATETELRSLAWAALCHDVGKPGTFAQGEDRIHFNGHDVLGAQMTDSMLRKLNLPSEVIDTAVYLVNGHMNQTQLNKARLAIRRRRLQDVRYPLLLELIREDTFASFGEYSCYLELLQWWLEEARTPKLPKPTLNGGDLLALGMKPSPLFRKILNDALDYELEHGFDSHEIAIAWLKQYLEKKCFTMD